MRVMDSVIFWVSVVILVWLVGQAELPKATQPTQPSPTQCTLKLTDRAGFAHLVTGEAQ